MISDFTWIIDKVISIFNGVAEEKKKDFARVGTLFENIADSLEEIAHKYKEGKVPSREFAAIQIYADELDQYDHFLSGKQEIEWRALISNTIVAIDGIDRIHFGFRCVPGPIFDRKEGWVGNEVTNPDELPDVSELFDVASALKAKAKVLTLHST